MHYQKYHKQINHKGEYSVAAEEGESNLRFKAMRKKNVTILLPALVPATCKPFRNLPLDQLKKKSQTNRNSNSRNTSTDD